MIKHPILVFGEQENQNLEKNSYFDKNHTSTHVYGYSNQSWSKVLQHFEDYQH